MIFNKERFMPLFETIDKRIKEQFGFKFKDTSFTKVVEYLYAPKDASSLAVTRILFGLAMLFDIPDERGGALMNKRWGEPKMCHFPLFSFIQAVSMPCMALVYALLWIGALGITLGYKYRITAPLFTICYWYLFLIEKSYWNNHSYLFGLVSFLLTCTNAHCYWSIDVLMEPNQFSETVPYWNYFILKYQFFILYFMAGVKKGTAEWLSGYSVPNLSAHWVFTPFLLFLTVEQTDYIIVHWFIFLFDLTVAFWMMWSCSRHIAVIFCALFHLMNSRLFIIGMFPWVCLATMPLFYPFDWPKLLIMYVKSYWMKLSNNKLKGMHKIALKDKLKSRKNDTNDESKEVYQRNDTKDEDNKSCEKNQGKVVIKNANFYLSNLHNDQIKTYDENVIHQDNDSNGRDKTSNNGKVEGRKKYTTVLIIIYILMQGFLPFSHFITKGYNNWTNGLYGYSWDMMVHTWDVQSVVIKVIDNENNKHFYVDPYVFTPNDRWFKHGDMIHQYATCLKNNLVKGSQKWLKNQAMLSRNISIYVDVWCAMNGRFVQRMFDTRVDLLRASWSPFQEVSYLMPLLDEASEWRNIIDQIRSEVHSWNQHSDVIFFADFPGYDLEKYIPPELSNTTLTILKGKVVLEPEVTKHQIGQSYQLNIGNHIKLDSGMFHKILNIGDESAFYMYIFYNSTQAEVENKKKTKMESKPKLPLVNELRRRLRDMIVFADSVIQGVYQSVF